jgi:hypothetical protein
MRSGWRTLLLVFPPSLQNSCLGWFWMHGAFSSLGPKRAIEGVSEITNYLLCNWVETKYTPFLIQYVMDVGDLHRITRFHKKSSF